MTAALTPFAPIPAAEVEDRARFWKIRSVEIITRDRYGVVSEPMTTDNSYVVFATLGELARTRGSITRVVHDGMTCDPDSLAALNSYLRTARIGRMGLPWHRQHQDDSSRWAWAEFCAHLGLRFTP